MSKVDFEHSYIATEKGEVIAYVVNQPMSWEETPEIIGIICEEAMYFWRVSDVWCKEGYGEILKTIRHRMHNCSIKGKMEMVYWFTPDQDLDHYFHENHVHIMPIDEKGEITYWVY